MAIEYLGTSTQVTTAGRAYTVHHVTNGKGDYHVLRVERGPHKGRLMCVFEHKTDCVHVQAVIAAISKRTPRVPGRPASWQ